MYVTFHLPSWLFPALFLFSPVFHLSVIPVYSSVFSSCSSLVSSVFIICSLVLSSHRVLPVFAASVLMLNWFVPSFAFVLGLLPQCNLATVWHHQRQFVRLHAASSGASRGCMLLFFTHAVVPVNTFTCSILVEKTFKSKFNSIASQCN